MEKSCTIRDFNAKKYHHTVNLADCSILYFKLQERAFTGTFLIRPLVNQNFLDFFGGIR